MPRLPLAVPAAVLLAVVSAFPSFAASDRSAGTTPTTEDAKALVLKASDELGKVGLDKACGEFQVRNGPYWQGDLYVFVLDFEGVWRCYPPRPAAVGTVLLPLQDVDGKFFIRDMLDLARTGGDGWVEYQWKNPANGMIQTKISYVKRVGGFVVAAGVFR